MATIVQMKRAMRSIHSKEVAAYKAVEKLPYRPLDAYTKDGYGNLTDDTGYPTYAWEFLRRDRFYQAEIDKRPQAKIDYWGYWLTSEHIGEASFGLLHGKPYVEPADEGVELKWKAREDITDRFEQTVEQVSKRLTRAGNGRVAASNSELEYSSHVALTFDLAPIFGPGNSGLDAQLVWAKVALDRLANEFSKRAMTSPAQTHGIGGRLKRHDKSLLRAYLRFADLVSFSRVLAVSTSNTNAPSDDQLIRLDTKTAAAFLPGYGGLHKVGQTVSKASVDIYPVTQA